MGSDGEGSSRARPGHQVPRAVQEDGPGIRTAGPQSDEDERTQGQGIPKENEGSQRRSRSSISSRLLTEGKVQSRDRSAEKKKPTSRENQTAEWPIKSNFVAYGLASLAWKTQRIEERRQGD